MKYYLGLLAAFILCGAPRLAGAENAELYQQGWPWSGTDHKSLNTFGWFQVLPDAGFVGNYEEPNANDADSGEPLSPVAVYFGGGKAGTGFFYTTNSAAAKTNQPGFAAIKISSCSNLTFTMEAQHGWQGSNMVCYFAVLCGGTWYVAMGQPIESYVQGAASGYFHKASLLFNPQAKNWTRLNPVTATLNAPAKSDLTGSITGAGIFVKLTEGGCWNFNKFAVTGSKLK